MVSGGDLSYSSLFESLSHDFIACGCQCQNSCVSPPLCPRIYSQLAVVKGKIYICTSVSVVETFEDLLFLNYSDCQRQMNAVRVLFPSPLHKQIICRASGRMARKHWRTALNSTLVVSKPIDLRIQTLNDSSTTHTHHLSVQFKKQCSIAE